MKICCVKLIVFFDIFKESVGYYLGYDDESIIEEMKEQEVNFKEI